LARGGGGRGIFELLPPNPTLFVAAAVQPHRDVLPEPAIVTGGTVILAVFNHTLTEHLILRTCP
jgi:hypothetical protein